MAIRDSTTGRIWTARETDGFARALEGMYRQRQQREGSSVSEDEKVEVPALVVRVDGDRHAVVPLRDGDDVFNAEAERGALDRAYEAKETNPTCAVWIEVLTVASGGGDA